MKRKNRDVQEGEQGERGDSDLQDSYNGVGEE